MGSDLVLELADCKLVFEVLTEDGIPRLNKASQVMLELQVVSQDGRRLVVFKGTRIAPGWDCILPTTSGPRNEYTVSKIHPLVQNGVLKWFRGKMESEGWTIKEIRNKMRGR